MSKFKRGIVLIAERFALALYLSAALVTPTGASPQGAMGKLKGIVVDWQYAIVLNTKIVLEGRSFKRDIALDEDGAYEAEVPVGSYIITAESPGFRRFRLEVAVVAGEVKTLNIMLKVLPQGPVKCPKGALCL